MISVRDLNHSFKIGKKGKEKRVPVLRGLSFDVAKGKLCRLSVRVDPENRRCSISWQDF